MAEGYGVQAVRPTVAVAARSPDLVRGVAFASNPAGAPLLLARGRQRALAYDVATGRPLGPAVTHAGISAAGFVPAQALLLTASADGSVRFWDVASGQESLPSLRVGAPVVRLAVVSRGRHLLTADANGTVRVWDLAARRALPTAIEHAEVAANSDSFAVDARGEHLLLTGDTGPHVVRLPAPDTGELRVVRPYAQVWLGVLALVGAAGVAGMVMSARRRAGRIGAITLRTRSDDVDAVVA
jgi:hypothetical protein